MKLRTRPHTAPGHEGRGYRFPAPADNSEVVLGRDWEGLCGRVEHRDRGMPEPEVG
jgi:hypothetical protein